MSPPGINAGPATLRLQDSGMKCLGWVTSLPMETLHSFHTVSDSAPTPPFDISGAVATSMHRHAWTQNTGTCREKTQPVTTRFFHNQAFSPVDVGTSTFIRCPAMSQPRRPPSGSSSLVSDTSLPPGLLATSEAYRDGAFVSPSNVTRIQLRYLVGSTTAVDLNTATMGTESNIPVPPQIQPKKATQKRTTTGCIRITSSRPINIVSTILPQKHLNESAPRVASTAVVIGSSSRPSKRITGRGRTIAMIGPTSGMKFSKKVNSPNTTDKSTPSEYNRAKIHIAYPELASVFSRIYRWNKSATCLVRGIGSLSQNPMYSSVMTAKKVTLEICSTNELRRSLK
mmetsp:Transcript_5277/g.15005  ORF Transcript_5277/g.15005 Transcript_5277/m.15005 type:complete len:341 (-) Transcript_5277:597-1619(-)